MVNPRYTKKLKSMKKLVKTLKKKNFRFDEKN